MKIAINGFGRIGRLVAARAQAFDMDVYAFDPYVSEEVAQDLGGLLPAGRGQKGVVARRVLPRLHHLGVDGGPPGRCRRGALEDVALVGGLIGGRGAGEVGVSRSRSGDGALGGDGRDDLPRIHRFPPVGPVLVLDVDDER